ncbi:MAG: alpha/beta hydrolase-fold protein [Bacteroidota bacterium]
MHCFFLSLLLLACSQPNQSSDASAQKPEVFPLGDIQQLDSNILDEKRTLNIYLPQGYHPDSGKTYPVVYLLDGSAHEDFPHVAGLVQFLNLYDLMPPSIVVGIANMDRYRDFTFPSSDSLDLKELPQSGHSDAFIQFIKQEVQPLIQQQYHTNGQKSLIGQSLGGLLAVEILLKEPKLFEDYLIVSPSLWWDQRSLLDKVPPFLKTHQDLEKRLFLSIGSEHPVMHEVFDAFAGELQNANLPGIQWTKVILPEETHGTILHNALYKGFLWMNQKEEKETND